MRSVLIVEDHPAVREALAETFFGWGYSVTAAGTIEDAAVEVGRGIFGLVLTDVDLGGVACVEWIRSLGISHPDVALIVMSGRFGAKDIFADGFESSGRRRYLKKPFLLSQLQAVVAELES
ncbi:MAG: response regulator [Acidobacteriia bacterium]|nr:response regulator [Terriglobia bacterium]